MKTTDLSRLTVTNLMKEVKETGQDVVEGLSAHPREISPKYFYDATGSQLFEQICELPEYYLTRTETAVLKASAKAIARATGPCELIELGSGSATKTRILFDAYQQENHPLHYVPVDVSDTMLTQSAQKLLTDYPQMTVQAIASTYEPALAHLPAQQLPKRMITFIGSSIGNLQPQACDRFIARIAQSLSAGDYFLLGIDLQKETTILEAAYNDTQGITAAFNLNMLRHLNQQFDANFQLEQFFHIAKYNTQSHQIEMYLESLIEQSVTLKTLNFTILLEKGEQILTEISRKFSISSMSETLSRHHLPVLETFTDANEWFALLLCQRT
ncbi:MAG: L-histidine N(alpha)-methyltransferase [Phormidesmis sp.]